MSEERFQMVVTVNGPADQLSAFAEACVAIGHLADIGASREVVVPVDGDGSASLTFDFGETDVSDVPLPTEESLSGSSGQVRTAWIGE